MSPSPQLAPAGSSTYSSNTLYVGDGTWDTERNTFLLPNLVGLNFDTMRFNGMGNRFREMPGYHSLIRAHGVIAAIVFLFIVPTAIFTLRFHTRNTRRAIQIHICLQILTVLLTTVVFVLGWFAVGPKRSLSNPHHGIGLAIYILVLAQTIGGWWVNRRDRKRRTLHTPLTAMVHHWSGRMIALLGLAQIPLGLTLYGSPAVLFILYALVAFALLLVYFILTYMAERRAGSDYDSRYSYGTGSVVENRRRSSRKGDLLKGGAAGIGIAALANKLRNRSKSRDRYDRPEVVGSRRHSGSYVDDEKYDQDEERRGGWRDRLLKIGAVGGTAAAARSLFNRRRDHDRDSDVEDYGPPLGGEVPINGGNSVTRVDQNRPVPSGQHPLNQPLHHRRSSSSMTYSSLMSASQEGRQGHGVRDAVAGLGAFGLARNIFKKRRERKEQKRLEQRQEDERRDRERNQRLTGDGTPRRHRHHGRHGSVTTTSFTGDSDPYPGTGPILGNPIPPVPAGVFPGAAGPSSQQFNRNQQQPPLPPQHNVTQPLPPLGNTTLGASNPVMTGAAPPIPLGQQAPVIMPPIPHDPQGILHQSYSDSESSASHQPRPRRGGRDATDVAVAGGASAGLAAAEASRLRERSRHHSGSGGDSVGSPPVSVKVKMHSDGRHVTLRRLPEEEAAAEREARRKSRDRNGRHRRGSASSVSDTGGDRWRRTEALERQQAEQMRLESERLAAARQAQQQPVQPQQSNLQVPLPPPPPIPEGSPRPPGRSGSVGSPGTYDGNITGTENSADYANNRRRRRAERAQAKLAKEGRAGASVDFT